MHVWTTFFKKTKFRLTRHFGVRELYFENRQFLFSYWALKKEGCNRGYGLLAIKLGSLEKKHLEFLLLHSGAGVLSSPFCVEKNQTT